MISRREFNRLGAAFLPTVGAINATLFNGTALAAGAEAPAKGPRRTVKFRSVRAPGILRRDDIMKPLKKKRCLQAFRTG